MSDRRAVSAGHLTSGVGASPVAADAWRVAVGGNRVESMTAEQIAHAFHSGQLNVRTPLWAPGSTGWQVLGNFEQFQMHPAAYAGAAALSQFEEADDDPTRMWTGGELPEYGASYAPSYEAAEPRPSVRTGTRPVASARPPAARPAPLPPPSVPQQPSFQQQGLQQHSVAQAQPSASAMPRPAPTASLPPSRATAVPMSIPPVRRGSKNGLMLVAGLVGLVGLGSAVLTARGNLGGSDADAAATETATAASLPSSEPAASAAAATPAAEPKAAEVAPAKYEDSPAAAGSVQKDAPAEKAAAEEPEAEAPAATDTKDEAEAEPKKAASVPPRAKDDAKKASYRSTPKRATTKSKSLALARVERAEKADRAERVEKAEKPERAVEKPEASADAPKAAPAAAAVNEAAAAALANSANLASSCRPRGGPSGAGKARVIYSNDGEVQSVEILTAKFRDTLTGSCVRMVFRRAKIPPFKGDPPSFIKTFTIPEE